MNQVTAKSIIDKASIQLADLKAIRWTRAELLDWITDAQNQIAILAPASTATTEIVELEPGTRQVLPERSWMLLDVYRNFRLDSSFRDMPGRAVRMISRTVLDRFDPNWHMATPRAEVVNYLYDIQEPSAYWVYPPNNGKGRLELNYSAMPAAILKETQAIEVKPVYQPAILDYVLFRACSKDAEYAPGLQLAQGYMATFMASVTGKNVVEDTNAPILPNDDNRRGSTS